MSSFLDIGPLQSGSGLDIGVLQSSSSGPLTITPAAAIPSRNSWGTPSLGTGFITLAAPIPSRNSWPTPFISHDHITLAAPIPSRNFWPSPLFITKLIAPAAAIPSRNSWGAPSVLHAEKFINLLSRPGIPSRNSWGTPVLTGGYQGPRLYLGGVDVTIPAGFALAGAGSNATASTIDSQAIGRATMTFDLADTTGAIVPGLYASGQAMCGLTVRHTENGATLFAGCIDTVSVDREMPFKGTPIITYHIVALDKTSICDHRYVTGQVYPAGMDIAQVIANVVQNYLNGEGITTQGVPADGSLGTLDSATSGSYETVRQMFDELATDSGTVWWIDPYGVLHFSPLADLAPSPWNIDETDPSAPFRNSPGTAMVVNSVSGSSQTSGYRNKEYVISNLNVLPGAGSGGGAGGGITETVIFTEGQPGVWDDPPGTPYGIFASLPIGTIQSLTVNGNVQTVYEFSSYAGQTSSGPNDFLWAYLSGGTQVGPTFGPLPAGATIVIVYVPGTGTNAASVVVGSASNPLTPTGPTFGHCGSGVFEYADQVQNVSDIDGLNALAQNFLNRSGAIPQIVTIETDKPGLMVGQSNLVNLPNLGITSQPMVVSQVNGTAQQHTLEFGSWWRWTVTLINNYDPANFITYMSRLVARTENALPVLQYETASLVTSGTGALSPGQSITNPYSVQRTGLFVDIRISASGPPVNQTLVVQMLRNGSVIATAVLPSGSPANVFIVTPAPVGTQLYLYGLVDVITWNSFYSPTGGTPVKATGVTVLARWSM